MLFRPTVDPGDPRSRAGIDPTIQRLVALAQLLPFEFREAAPCPHRDQLLGHQLLQPFAVNPVGQVNEAGRSSPVPCPLVFQRLGDERRSFAAYAKAYEINPSLESVKTILDRMRPDVEGRDI